MLTITGPLTATKRGTIAARDEQIQQSERKSISSRSHELVVAGLGRAARIRMKKTDEDEGLQTEPDHGGSTGPIQPPKKSVVIRAEISVMPRYSPTKNMPNFMPEYSEW